MCSYREQSVTEHSGVLFEVFHQFSSVASTLCHAASPVVPGLFVVAMALKELDNIVQKNQVADVRHETNFNITLTAML